MSSGGQKKDVSGLGQIAAQNGSCIVYFEYKGYGYFSYGEIDLQNGKNRYCELTVYLIPNNTAGVIEDSKQPTYYTFGDHDGDGQVG